MALVSRTKGVRVREDFRRVAASKLRPLGRLGAFHAEGREEEFFKHGQMRARGLEAREIVCYTAGGTSLVGWE